MSDKIPILKVTKDKDGFGRYNPDCPITQAIVAIAGKKTLRRTDLELLDKAGFTIEVE